MVTFAVTLSDLIEKGGAYAGLAAFFGLAVLAVLYFAQARELKRLREWAGRAPERAQEIEERVVAQAEQARRARPAPAGAGAGAGVAAAAKPAAAKGAGQPATAAALSAAPPTAVASTPAVDGGQDATSETPAVPSATPPTEDGSPAEHEVVVSKAVPEEETAAGETDEDGDREAVGSRAAAPGAAQATASGAPPATASTAPPKTQSGSGSGSGSGSTNGSGEIPVLPPRATPTPPPRRSAPAPAPYRPDRPLPPRSPLTSHLGEDPPRRNGAVIAGAGAGVVLLVVAIIAILGGGGNDGGGPTTSNAGTTTATQPSGQATTAPTSSPGKSGGNRPTGPTRPETKVEVLNGTTIAGLGQRVADQVEGAGWAPAGVPVNFYEQTRSATIVFYATSVYRTQAQAVAKTLGVSDVQLVDANTRRLAMTANVIVVVGSDQGA